MRPKFKHKTDRAQPPVLAPAPARPVTGGYASAGLLAWVTTAKYVDHLPLFRQEKMLARWGAPIPRQSLCDWIDQVTNWCAVLARAMHSDLLESGYLQLDETPIHCNDPAHPGKTSTGWLWVLNRPGGDVVFCWRLSRRHEELPPLLKHYKALVTPRWSAGAQARNRRIRTHQRENFPAPLAVSPLTGSMWHLLQYAE